MFKFKSELLILTGELCLEIIRNLDFQLNFHGFREQRKCMSRYAKIKRHIEKSND